MGAALRAKDKTSDAVACAVVRVVAGCLLDSAACLAPGSRGQLRPPDREAFLEGARCALRDMKPDGERPDGVVLEAEEPKRCALLGALDMVGILVRLGGTLNMITGAVG